MRQVTTALIMAKKRNTNTTYNFIVSFNSGFVCIFIYLATKCRPTSKKVAIEIPLKQSTPWKSLYGGVRGKTWQKSDPGLQEAAPSTSTSRWLAVVSALLICPSAHTVQWCRAMCANMYHTLEESSACVCSSSALDSVHWEMCFRVSLFLFDHFKRSVMYLVVCMLFRKNSPGDCTQLL